jgi:cysteine desulfurase/selenocysteine lyase
MSPLTTGTTALATRADFPVLAREVDGVPLVYLDSAATSLKPRAVIDEVVRYYSEVGANIHRGKHMLSEEASDTYERARQRLAEFVGARADCLAFTAGTTASVNLVAAGLGLDQDDLVLVSADAHHSQLLPWRERARVRAIPTLPDGTPDLDGYAALLAEAPAVVALTHCSNVTGYYTPVARMTAMAREREAVVVLDGAQSVPHRPVDMTALGVDALAFSAHKMLGPTGIGALALTPALAARLRPAVVGGGVVDWVDAAGSRLRRAPHRFEAGTPHIAGAYGFAAAVDYLRRLGTDRVAEHDRELGTLLHALAGERDTLTVLGPADGDRGGIISVAVRGCPDLGDLARILSDSFGVMCRSGHHCAQPFVDSFGAGQALRISGHVYTTAEEVRAAFTALDQVIPLVTR